jgi:hypothetical protein
VSGAQPPVIGGRRVAKRALSTMTQRSPSRRRIADASLLNLVATAQGLLRVPASGQPPFLRDAAAKLQAVHAFPVLVSGIAGTSGCRFLQRPARLQASSIVDQQRLLHRKTQNITPAITTTTNPTQQEPAQPPPTSQQSTTTTTTTSDDDGDDRDYGMTQDSLGTGTIPPPDSEDGLSQPTEGETVGVIVAGINFAAPPPLATDTAEDDDNEAPPLFVVTDVEADLPGYQPTPADLLLDTVYGDHVHDNDGTHLNGGIANDAFWQCRWKRMAQLATTRYQVPKGKVGRRFLTILTHANTHCEKAWKCVIHGDQCIGHLETDKACKWTLMPSSLFPNTDSIVNRYQRHKDRLCSGVFLSMPECVCKHTLGTNMVSSVCTDLMDKRREIKKSMKIKSSTHRTEQDIVMESNSRKVKDLLQWACNTVVLLYPDVQQYMVPSHLRTSDHSYSGFLCCCSSPSSASSKGMVRYLASNTVIRCYNSGVNAHAVSISSMLKEHKCTCSTQSSN